ncbi:B12-binding domain-containing radical SAM protein [Aneurinibacillus migulanus]|uniref:Anaerobic magnesium-protoporphyrin IX monomethyl ester cyclase n=1 Tax=Aneurinibacillus migulanus TaxID=47500 RepID=A0A0D1Y1G4_ANEMI|nr:B12-binding domain-containing radical SAM protein [Aneurinibacillus migulanus]KIV60386.1 Fe-S oxidoreductase [Aneurinibacillus migulanus]KON94974.1 Fe-S oxidoreductase [Aneurinibacillus migulanus]MED0895940.1 B12-binding domain-containing radical SAM protein [Aneurinibacillus migulanus]MED1619598.1 B12-binding domain-containing radical SAM protein [Aneurinibacillus migulanus]SDK28429.1 anaerobic magnesium-protoporphyrin IX monomethyl ester cyclase [Aneurinibacillus migulanus]
MNVLVTTLNAKYIHTSLALRYLKAFCQDDFKVELTEYTIKDPAMNVVSDLFQRKPDVIGFSCYIWNIEETIQIISMLKKVMPEVKVVLGGPEVSYDVEYWMNRLSDIDFIVVGEGEETFHHLLKEIEGEQKYHFVYGVAYRKNGETIINPPRPKLDLNRIPSPFYFKEDMQSLGNRVTYFETSRGCPFSCQFCLSSIEVGVRYFDIERTKRDLLHLIESGAKLIKFVDRTFNIKRDYALEIFQFLIDNHQGCVFQFEITADIMRPEVLDYLAEYAPPGIFRFEIGVQSTNDATNDIVKRRQNFTKLARTVTKVKESGKIDQHLDLIAGLPEEDYMSFRKTFNDVFALRPEELQLGFLKMLRGTGMRISAEKYEYKYMDHAPYEILENGVLPFSDIVRIKRVEDVLEKYWNAHRMDHTLLYLMKHEFASAFDFFQEFGDFWEAGGWSRIGHQLEDLFTRLHLFLRQRGTERLPIIEALMKYDYFMNYKYKPRKVWWSYEIEKAEQSRLLKVLAQQPEIAGEKFAALGLDEKQLHKHTMLEILPIDLASYVTTGDMKREDTLLLVYYNPEESDRPNAYFIPLSALQRVSA